MGDYVWLEDEKVIDSSPNQNRIRQAQLARGISSTGTSLIVDRPIEYDFTTAINARLGIPTVVSGCGFENVKWGSFEAVRGGVGLKWHDPERAGVRPFHWLRRPPSSSASASPRISLVSGDPMAGSALLDAGTVTVSNGNIRLENAYSDGRFRVNVQVSRVEKRSSTALGTLAMLLKDGSFTVTSLNATGGIASGDVSRIEWVVL
ncbi:MAG: hypothetical protein HWE30_16545 [Methylocystaceae bacterium]|nr:hypothetical protein [Methylocystaceae bacterium]